MEEYENDDNESSKSDGAPPIAAGTQEVIEIDWIRSAPRAISSPPRSNKQVQHHLRFIH